jgi:hypothetical protein
MNNIKKLKYVTILVERGTSKTKNIKNGNLKGLGIFPIQLHFETLHQIYLSTFILPSHTFKIN